MAVPKEEFFGKIQQLSLESAYKTNESIRHFCEMLDAGAFIPLDDVQEVSKQVSLSTSNAHS